MRIEEANIPRNTTIRAWDLVPGRVYKFSTRGLVFLGMAVQAPSYRDTREIQVLDLEHHQIYGGYTKTETVVMLWELPAATLYLEYQGRNTGAGQ